MEVDRNTLRPLASEAENNFCFGCSPQNPHGLHMTFYTDDETLYSWVNVPEYLCGWGNVVHTGIQAAILDEIMGRGAVYLSKCIAITTGITLNLNKPVFWDKGELLAQTRMIEYCGEREVIMQGEIFQDHPEPNVTAQATFRLFTPESIGRFNIMNQTALNWFQKLVTQR